jgi:hypothetical protein
MMEQSSLDVAKQAYAPPLLRRWSLTHGFRAGGAPGSMAQDYRFQKKAVYKKGVSYFVLGIAVVTGAAFACGQTLRPILIAQAPNSVPSSGVLTTQPPAPVALPWSGVLETEPTIERRAITTPPSKTTQKVQTAKRETPVTMRHHGAHRESAGRRETIARTTTVDQSVAATSTVVGTAAERPHGDGIGYENFLSLLGKEKEAK